MGFQQHIGHIRQSLADISSKTETVINRSKLSQRPPQLIAVSKQQPDDKIRAALIVGHRHFGENKVQEAYAHWVEFKKEYNDITLHLIGPLQSNKTAEAVALFDVIHTIDRTKIADAIKSECAKQHKTIPCFIQVNTGEEEQKAGVSPKDAPELIDHCRQIGLPIIGLMCIPPADMNPAPHFALLHEMAKTHELIELSMGMSADYEIATRFGSTYIRVGTGIFGERL